jgi:hypothetical protein
MPRYYFDVHNGDLVRDRDGVECSDLEEIKKCAKGLHASVINTELQLPNDWVDCRVFVRNQSDEIIYMCTFSYSGAWINVTHQVNGELQFGGASAELAPATRTSAVQVFTPGR